MWSHFPKPRYSDPAPPGLWWFASFSCGFLIFTTVVWTILKHTWAFYKPFWAGLARTPNTSLSIQCIQSNLIFVRKFEWRLSKIEQDWRGPTNTFCSIPSMCEHFWKTWARLAKIQQNISLYPLSNRLGPSNTFFGSCFFLSCPFEQPFEQHPPPNAANTRLHKRQGHSTYLIQHVMFLQFLVFLSHLGFF